MRVKSIVVASLLFVLCHTASARTAEIKINLLAGAVAIVNPSMEIGFGDNSAVTIDYVGAFAEKEYLNSGCAFLMGMGIFGYRYYLLDKSHSGLFVGGDAGLNVFRMNKNFAPLAANDKNSQSYDVGHGHLFGVTIGYKYPISHHFNLEASLSGGWQYSMHEGYKIEGERYVEFNPSGEWLLYKAGVYLNYKF